MLHLMGVGVILSRLPFHIRAKRGDIASRAIIAGDPARVKHLSTLLDNAKVVNTNRGLLTYTGLYKGVPITIATHGIGGPSAAIVIEELAMLGAKVIIRFGTAGGLIENLDLGDIVVVSGAIYISGGNAIGMYVPGVCMCTSPHPEVTYKIMKSLKEQGLKYVLGPVFSSDAFYAEDSDFARKWEAKGVIAVEMECAVLFSLGWMRNLKTGAVLLINNNLTRRRRYIATAEELKPKVLELGRAVLNALININEEDEA